MSIASPVRKIKQIYFTNLNSGQVYRIEKMVRRNHVTVAKLKGGGYWCSHVNGRYFYTFGHCPAQEDVLRCLLDLKAITQREYDRHMSMYEEYERGYKLKRDSEKLAELIERHGSIEKLREKIDEATGVLKRKGEEVEVIAAEEDE